MNANDVVKALRACARPGRCPDDCPTCMGPGCEIELILESADLLEAALADMKKAAPCALCIHHGTPECYFRQRGMFCRELPNGGKFEWCGLHPERKENENVQ